MTRTRPQDLAVAAVLAGLLVNLMMQIGYSALPPLPVLGGIPPLVLGAAEVVLGVRLRARIRRRPGVQPLQPLTAARAVLLAKASALGGALLAGGWLGVFGHVLPLADEFPAAGTDTAAALVGALCAAALGTAGLWLEHCCRSPDDRDEWPNRDHK